MSTDYHKLKLTPREMRQIVAALVFWQRAARTSRVHPKDHPHAGVWFDKDHPPMLEAEIDRLRSVVLGVPDSRNRRHR